MLNRIAVVALALLAPLAVCAAPPGIGLQGAYEVGSTEAVELPRSDGTGYTRVTHEMRATIRATHAAAGARRGTVRIEYLSCERRVSRDGRAIEMDRSLPAACEIELDEEASRMVARRAPADLPRLLGVLARLPPAGTEARQTARVPLRLDDHVSVALPLTIVTARSPRGVQTTVTGAGTYRHAIGGKLRRAMQVSITGSSDVTEAVIRRAEATGVIRVGVEGVLLRDVSSRIWLRRQGS